jgi:hypothetical protein
MLAWGEQSAPASLAPKPGLQKIGAGTGGHKKAPISEIGEGSIGAETSN